MKICKFCQKDIPNSQHGHAVYCTEECYANSKKQRQKTRYAMSRDISAGLYKNYILLTKALEKFAEQEFPFDWLLKYGFQKNLITSISQSNQRKLYYVHDIYFELKEDIKQNTIIKISYDRSTLS